MLFRVYVIIFLVINMFIGINIYVDSRKVDYDYMISNNRLYVSFKINNDSKKLTPEKREKMFEQIKQYPNIFQYDFISLSPQYLSEKMLLRNKINLNKISHDSAILLINNALSKNVNLTNIFVDTDIQITKQKFRVI